MQSISNIMTYDPLMKSVYIFMALPDGKAIFYVFQYFFVLESIWVL